MKSKEQIAAANEQIRKAILVSQMQEHPGFSHFLEDQEDVIKNVQFQDIRFVKSETLEYSKGYVQAILDLKDYLENQKLWALKPMMDEETGELEVLNNKEQ